MTVYGTNKVSLHLPLTRYDDTYRFYFDRSMISWSATMLKIQASTKITWTEFPLGIYTMETLSSSRLTFSDTHHLTRSKVPRMHVSNHGKPGTLGSNSNLWRVFGAGPRFLLMLVQGSPTSTLTRIMGESHPRTRTHHQSKHATHRF